MRVASYARVSTPDQREDLPPQVERLAAFVAARWPKAEHVPFAEIASGATQRRPRLLELLSQIDRRKLDVVVITKLDRLSRTLADGIQLVDRIQAAGCGLVAIEQPIDTTTPAGRAGAHLLQVFAEWQREDLRERAQRGIQDAKKRGVRFGRPSSTGQVDLVEVERLRTVGQTLQQIADTLGVSRFALRRSLDARSRAESRIPGSGAGGNAADPAGDPPSHP